MTRLLQADSQRASGCCNGKQHREVCFHGSKKQTDLRGILGDLAPTPSSVTYSGDLEHVFSPLASISFIIKMGERLPG